MSTYHYQCQYCYCTISKWEDDDGKDDFYGGATQDCGCRNTESSYHEDDSQFDEWD